MTKEPSAVAKELTELGFVTPKLRRGIVIGFMSILIITIVVLWGALNKANNKIQYLNDKYQQVFIRMIDKQLETKHRTDTVLINR